MPKSRPNFAEDKQHDFRDFQYDCRAETLARVTGIAADAYLRACTLLGREDDPVADCLRSDDRFNVQTLQVAHDYLAAYWRYKHLETAMNTEGPFVPYLEPACMRVSYRGLLGAFRRWLEGELRVWSLHFPALIRTICLILVQQNVSRGVVLEIDLWDELNRLYPMPQPPFPDPA